MTKGLLVSSLLKVFSDGKFNMREIETLSALRGENLSFQTALSTDENSAVLSLQIKSVLQPFIKTYEVKEIPVGKPSNDTHDDYVLRDTPGMYPDLLRPLTKPVELKKNMWQSLWFELCIPRNQPAGEYNIELLFTKDGQLVLSKLLVVEIIAADLPEQTLICTNWFHTDCLSTWYKYPVFSDEYWIIVENYIRTAVQHGINFILTPLFTPALDTEIGTQRPTVQLVDVFLMADGFGFDFSKLAKWVEICDKCGVKYFEMSHLFSQWGAKFAPKIVVNVNGELVTYFGWHTASDSDEYKDFLRQFARALVDYINKLGIRERCYFHISDEPSLEAFEEYKARSEFISELFPGFPLIDALSAFEFFKSGVSKIPIPAVNHADEFIDNVPELWSYYCCGQDTEYVPNRFIAMPSQRNRVYGFQLFSLNAKGILQWGYNFWYARLSLYEIDPFKTADGDNTWPAGDPFVVYPGEDGSPLCSLRLKVFYDGLQDMRACQLLQKLIGRENTLKILHLGLNERLTFKEYPRNDDWQLRTRERINMAIKEAIKL